MWVTQAIQVTLLPACPGCRWSVLLMVGSREQKNVLGAKPARLLLREVILEEEELFLILVCNLTSSYKVLTLNGL